MNTKFRDSYLSMDKARGRNTSTAKAADPNAEAKDGLAPDKNAKPSAASAIIGKHRTKRARPFTNILEFANQDGDSSFPPLSN